MSSSFTIKKGDTGPPLQVTLRGADGVAVNITGNSGVTFRMKERQHIDNDAVARKVDAAGTVVDAAGGIVKYVWTAPDTDTVAEYVGEFVVVLSDATIRTFPSPEFITVRVVGDL